MVMQVGHIVGGSNDLSAFTFRKTRQWHKNTCSPIRSDVATGARPGVDIGIALPYMYTISTFL